VLRCFIWFFNGAFTKNYFIPETNDIQTGKMAESVLVCRNKIIKIIFRIVAGPVSIYLSI
jgi:hypothetical protein